MGRSRRAASQLRKASGLEAGKKLAMPWCRPSCPTCPRFAADLLDYAVEIETFDKQLGELLALLEESGVYRNTLVVVTSDNGMPFPRGNKALSTTKPARTCARYFLAPPRCRAVARSDDLVSLVDLAPTYLEAGRRSRGPRNFRGLAVSCRCSYERQVGPRRTRADGGLLIA